MKSGRRRWPRRLAVWGVLALLVVSLARYLNSQPAGNDPRQTGATLLEEPRSVLFDPGRGPGERMRLDWADVKKVAHTDFLRRNGHGNLPQETRVTTESLAGTGFPSMALTWPSLHMPQDSFCRSSVAPVDEDCAVVVTGLTSEAPRGTSQQLDQGDVWQWTAFQTRGRWSGAQWAGWQCDARRQQEMNQSIGAPDADRREWPVHPLVMQPHCGRAQGLLERRAPWLAGLQEHPVLWSCPRAADRNARSTEGTCSASFVHAGRLVRLRMPGRAWIGDAEHRMPALLRLRPQLVEAAWRTLEDARLAALRDAPPPAWEDAIQRELGWCQAIATRTGELRRAGKVVEARDAWDRSGRIATADTRGPCARALHRVLRQWQQTAQTAKPAPLLVNAARRLAQFETAESPMLLSRPVWALNRELITRQAGPGSLALLQWQVQQRYKEEDAAAIVAAYDALRDQIARLPAPDRLRLREGLTRDGASKGPLAERAAELDWEFASDWLQSPGALELGPQRRFSLLLQSADGVRRLPLDEARRRLELLLPAIDAHMREFAAATDLSGPDRLVLVATLALHAAWHANWLAVNDPQPARWKLWLAELAAWSAGALPGGPRDWAAGVALHRDAAAQGRLTQPDCPGGAMFACQWAYQPTGARP